MSESYSFPLHPTSPDHTSHNTGLPASVASLLPPNPCPVTAFAEGQRRKCRAQAAGSATRGRYAQCPKDNGLAVSLLLNGPRRRCLLRFRLPVP